MRARLQRPSLLAAVLILCAALAVAAGQRERGVEEVRPEPTVAGSEEAAGGAGESAPGAAGVRVYLDPVTGELRGRPPVEESEAAVEERLLTPAERLNTYGGDLIQEPVPLGGFKVDLRGRFQSSVIAVIDPETGELSYECERSAAGGETDDER